MNNTDQSIYREKELQSMRVRRENEAALLADDQQELWDIWNYAESFAPNTEPKNEHS